jgi:hypothetical protein
MIELFQLASELPEVIDFAVEDNCDRSGFVPDGLAPAGQVNDAEAARARSDVRHRQQSFFVGASMNNCGKHPAHDCFASFFRIKPDGATDPAHEG